MANGLTFDKLNISVRFFLPLSGFYWQMTFAKFPGNQFKIDGESLIFGDFSVNTVYPRV